MHDQKEYGVLRWTLKEIAKAVGCKISDLNTLVNKGVLKGADIGNKCEPFVYRPRHGRKYGDPVTLIAEQPGPIWYSSRMVKDEYVRMNKASPNDTPNDAPKPPTGVPLGVGPSSSTSSSTSPSGITTTGGNTKEALFFEMFRRSSGPQISDDELKVEVGKFINKYPNIHPNQAGPLVNGWVARIGEEPKQEKKIVV